MVNKDVHGRFKQQCERLGASMADMTEAALEDFIMVMEKSRPLFLARSNGKKGLKK